ncbi:MAG: zinc ribbon domain-containing protein [Anaerolineaceae bacterium]|nr:MAG: zinc ribbon domain-containing protein [Anaerolineaceae bacterium]
MPIYEYICLDCETKFDALRSMSDADAPILCSKCESGHTSRTISLFAAHSDGRVVAGAGNACNTCSTHNCSSCGI